MYERQTIWHAIWLEWDMQLPRKGRYVRPILNQSSLIEFASNLSHWWSFPVSPISMTNVLLRKHPGHRVMYYCSFAFNVTGYSETIKHGNIGLLAELNKIIIYFLIKYYFYHVYFNYLGNLQYVQYNIGPRLVFKIILWRTRICTWTRG